MLNFSELQLLLGVAAGAVHEKQKTLAPAKEGASTRVLWASERASKGKVALSGSLAAYTP
jgi:hypothetical protein